MQKELAGVALVLLLLLFVWVSGIFSPEDDGAVETPFPEFSAVADDGNTYSLDDYRGAPFIVLFSAEWCTPCDETMHALNFTLDASIIVMSTDPAENPSGISLQDWHERADEYDDDGNDTGQALDFPFMKGVEAADEAGISSSPSIVFINSDGGIVTIHKGGLNDADEIRSYWVAAGGSV
jgi:thiol-disulfide isomerase/thioredoxin